MNGFIEDSSERKRFKRIEYKHYDVCTKREYEAIINQILHKTSSNTRFRNALVVKLLWETSARIGEILNVKIKDVNFKENTIRLTDTKGYEERIVVFSNGSLELIKTILNVDKRNKERYLFESEKNNQLYKGSVNRAFKEAIKVLKENGTIGSSKRIVIHSIRHGRISELLDTLPIDLVKEYVGHKSVKTTMIYAHSKERLNAQLNEVKKTL
ncbi:tyrosine-type recombinase/integrase [Methanococcus voltae]|uniref:tyrosine-type recombinase/integrase n=1 Tax=Methanococcus voltae TaxID=2188 RepID=UPI001AE58002|nr:tyrosine-type recombinase/integrase [Methanococcus voltae]MBP2173264.1 integrase [Methanococcus voltae]